MRNAMIYPFSDNSLPLFTHFSDFQPEYQVTSVVSPPGAGLDGQNPFHAANRSGKASVVVNCDVHGSLQKCDALIVPFGDHKHDPLFIEALPVMRLAAEMGKEIFCALKLTKSQRKEFMEICERNGASWHDGFLETVNLLKKVPYSDFSITAPVVFVHNLDIEADSFEITLSLAKRLRRDGYKVSVIGPKPEYNLLGLHGSSVLLNMLYGRVSLNNIPQIIQILKLYVYVIETIEKPDVILFQCPGAAAQMNDYFQNDSGVFTYLISRAIRPDFSLVCMAYGTPTKEAIKIIHAELEHQFGFGIDALHISNRALHLESTRYSGKEQHVYLPAEKALEKVRRIRIENNDSIPVFSALQEIEQELLYKEVVCTLSSF